VAKLIDDSDIFRAAKLLIDRYGERADLCANRRSKELLLRGYVEASGLWGEVVAAIEQLQRGPDEVSR
jgi:hypothetical protein